MQTRVLSRFITYYEVHTISFQTFFLKHSIRFCGIFPSLKQNFIAYRSSKVSSRPDCIFEILQLWQSGFSRVYSNCCCSCSFEAEIIKIGQSSHKMYSNKILNSQESTTILNAHTKKVWKLIVCTSYNFTNHMHKEDLSLNNLQWLICHKTKPNEIIYIWYIIINRICH